VRLGTTRDDAIGEAFDKTAKLLGLGYPGGPRVEQEAARGDAERFTLPRPMIGRRDADFSLSGLKTALRLEAEKIAPLLERDVADLCASFQRAVVETVIDRLRHGLRMFRERFGAPSALVASGGVAANGAIRAALLNLAAEDGVPLIVPPPALCTDNGAMIAWAGAERLAYGLCDTLDTAPRARWPLAQVGKPGGVETPAPGTADVAPVLPDSGETPMVPAGTPEQTPETTAQTSEIEKAEAGTQTAQPLSPPPLAGDRHEGGPATCSEPAAGPSPQLCPDGGGVGAGETATAEGSTPASPHQPATPDTASAGPATKPDQPPESCAEPGTASDQIAAEPAQPAAADAKPSAAA
jgi:N6-L-threonylcarbamoyladenine synthase